MNILLRLLSPKIEINTKDNTNIIDIKKELSLEEYTTIIKKSLYKDLLNLISLKYLLEKGSQNIQPKQIILLTQDNITYIIVIQNNTYTISRITKELKIIEESFQLNTQTKDYRITKYIHELDGNTKDVKTYNKDETKNLSFMLIPKKEALQIVRNIISSITTHLYLNDYLSISDITNIFNIVLENEYYPVISNETITLSWPRRYGQTNINNKTRCSLDIILNETEEKIGEITFNYLYNIKSSYTGNVGYHIKEEFRNRGYATQALTLLKQLLKKNTHPGNKDLYIATTPQNYYSQKVALNNNAELYYEGEIPINDPLSRHSGITEIKLYRIKI